MATRTPPPVPQKPLDTLFPPNIPKKGTRFFFFHCHIIHWKNTGRPCIFFFAHRSHFFAPPSRNACPNGLVPFTTLSASEDTSPPSCFKLPSSSSFFFFLHVPRHDKAVFARLFPPSPGSFPPPLRCTPPGKSHLSPHGRFFRPPLRTIPGTFLPYFPHFGPCPPPFPTPAAHLDFLSSV